MKLRWNKYKECASHWKLIAEDTLAIGYTCFKPMRLVKKYACVWYPVRDDNNEDILLVSNNSQCCLEVNKGLNVRRMLINLSKKKRDMFLFDSLEAAMKAAQSHFDGK